MALALAGPQPRCCSRAFCAHAASRTLTRRRRRRDLKGVARRRQWACPRSACIDSMSRCSGWWIRSSSLASSRSRLVTARSCTRRASACRTWRVASQCQRTRSVRIYSMTKPVTGVAMMILYEEGKWQPDDPIAKYLPEFADLKVLKSVKADGQPELEAPLHPPTMGELMTHTAGFTYGVFSNSWVDQQYSEGDHLAGDIRIHHALADGARREARAHPPRLSARHALAVQRLSRHSGTHRGEAVGAALRRFPARAHLRAAADAGHRLLRAREQARAARDPVPARPGAARACGPRAGSRSQCTANADARGHRPVFDSERLPALCADAAQRGRAGRRTHSRHRAPSS